MFVLERLISRGSRALGVMIGTSRKGAGHAQGGREGDSDDDAQLVAASSLPLLPFFVPIRFPAVAAAQRRRARSFVF